VLGALGRIWLVRLTVAWPGVSDGQWETRWTASCPTCARPGPRPGGLHKPC